MNIALVSSHPTESLLQNFGDAIRKKYVIDLFQKNGHQVLPVVAADNHETQGRLAAAPSVKKASKRMVPLKLWGTIKDIEYMLHDRRLTQNFSKKMRQFRPNVIYDFNYYLHKVSVRWARQLKVPLIMEVLGPETHIRYADESSFLRNYGERFEISKYREADTVVAVSEPLKKYLVNHGVPEHKIVVISSWADFDRFNKDTADGKGVRKKLGLEKSMVVGFVGVFSPWYGLELLIDSVSDLAEKFPELQLLLVGDGVMRGAMEQRIRERKIGDHVKMTGFVHHSEIPSYIAAMDATVIPNHQWWCSPWKLFEYGAMAKPVLSARVPSITSIADDSEVLFFPNNSKEDLTAALRRLLNSSSLRAGLAERLLKKIKEQYDLRVVGQKFLKVLQCN